MHARDASSHIRSVSEAWGFGILELSVERRQSVLSQMARKTVIIRDDREREVARHVSSISLHLELVTSFIVLCMVPVLVFAVHLDQFQIMVFAIAAAIVYSQSCSSCVRMVPDVYPLTAALSRVSGVVGYLSAPEPGVSAKVRERERREIKGIVSTPGSVGIVVKRVPLVQSCMGKECTPSRPVSFVARPGAYTVLFIERPAPTESEVIVMSSAAPTSPTVAASPLSVSPSTPSTRPSRKGRKRAAPAVTYAVSEVTIVPRILGILAGAPIDSTPEGSLIAAQRERSNSVYQSPVPRLPSSAILQSPTFNGTPLMSVAPSPMSVSLLNGPSPSGRASSKLSSKDGSGGSTLGTVSIGGVDSSVLSGLSGVERMSLMAVAPTVTLFPATTLRAFVDPVGYMTNTQLYACLSPFPALLDIALNGKDRLDTVLRPRDMLQREAERERERETAEREDHNHDHETLSDGPEFIIDHTLDLDGLGGITSTYAILKSLPLARGVVMQSKIAVVEDFASVTEKNQGGTGESKEREDVASIASLLRSNFSAAGRTVLVVTDRPEYLKCADYVYRVGPDMTLQAADDVMQ
ncbi:hypothetical protein KIPB_009819 [Kipferlia bialata]|uniref:Uncharacterized protein n=1 Tax=Kipferlia bialata TaxID=797122 RepID=A0A9K3D2Z9_9EUKA|nr:hypothetical protein KIPB_009819 [Kipferlia bialata]|eukprot:g9819.t1